MDRDRYGRQQAILQRSENICEIRGFAGDVLPRPKTKSLSVWSPIYGRMNEPRITRLRRGRVAPPDDFRLITFEPALGWCVSKAFTRESDEARPEENPSYRPQLPFGARNYITAEGAERLKQRLNELLERKRSSAIRSNEGGTAWQDQQSLESDIRKLQQILDSVVIAKIPADQEKVAFGATVMIRHGNGQEETYQIVGVEEADPERGCISWVSPLARVLLSRKTGEKLKFQSPAGSEELTILSVRYPSP